MPGGVVVPPTLKRIKVSAIQTPDAGPNHTTVLRQAKESIEVGQRLRGDVNDSYVRVSELVALGLATIANGQVQLTGGAAAGLPSGPPSSIPAPPGTLELTDGTTDVKTVSKITVSGATVGGTSPAATLTVTGGSPLTTKGDLYGFDTANNRIPVGSNGQVLTADSTQALGVKWAAGGSSPPVPATIPSLLLWYKMDVLDAPTSAALNFLGNFAPNYVGMGGVVAVTGGKVSATQLNSLNVLTLVGAEDYDLMLVQAGTQRGPIPHKSTVFVVANPSSLTSGSGFGNDIISGSANSALEVRVDTAGKLNLVQQGVVVIGTSTSAVATVGSWSQFNYTYDDSTGAFSFRSAQAANGSGTNVKAISQPWTALLWFGSGGGVLLDWLGSIAEIIIYNRVLTGTEITNVEAYLHTKWGV